MLSCVFYWSSIFCTFTCVTVDLQPLKIIFRQFPLSVAVTKTHPGRVMKNLTFVRVYLIMMANYVRGYCYSMQALANTLKPMAPVLISFCTCSQSTMICSTNHHQTTRKPIFLLPSHSVLTKKPTAIVTDLT